MTGHLIVHPHKKKYILFKKLRKMKKKKQNKNKFKRNKQETSMLSWLMI